MVFDVRTDTNDNGGGKVREYRCPARHRIVPYTSIRKSLSSAGKRSGLGHVRPHDLRHTFVTRMLDLSVPIEQVNYLGVHIDSTLAGKPPILSGYCVFQRLSTHPAGMHQRQSDEYYTPTAVAGQRKSPRRIQADGGGACGVFRRRCSSGRLGKRSMSPPALLNHGPGLSVRPLPLRLPA